MALKHDFAYMSASDNALWGAMVEVNNATSGLFIHGLIVILFVVLAYTMIKSTQDIGKSLVSALFITSVISLILYYAGKTQAVDFVSDVFMLGLLVVNAISITAIFYNRLKT